MLCPALQSSTVFIASCIFNSDTETPSVQHGSLGPGVSTCNREMESSPGRGKFLSGAAVTVPTAAVFCSHMSWKAWTWSTYLLACFSL